MDKNDILGLMPQRPKNIRMYCLGGFRFEAEDMATIDFGTQKARALLAYLAIESPREFRRTHLAGLLWSDYSEQKALHNLRQTLVRLRKGWAQGAAPIPLLITRGDTVALNPEAGLWVDLLAFEAALGRAMTHVRDHHRLDGLDILSLIEAVDLFQAPFLDRFSLADTLLFDEWASTVRECTTKKALEALTLLCQYHQRRGEYGRAAHLADRITELAPWDNQACATSMRLYALQKQWTPAQEHYRQFQAYLDRNLGLSPNPGLTALYEEIRGLSQHDGDLQPLIPLTADQLPELPTAFIGRDDEIQHLSAMLANPENRLISLVGRGGTGKTRLAAALGHLARGLYAHGVFFIPLRNVSSLEGLDRLMEESLRQTFTGTTSHHRQLIDFLRGKQCLLILDGCEHHLLQDQIRHLLREILASSPDVKILATSRSRLNLPEEHAIPLAGLDYQPGVPAPKSPGEATNEAVRLFEARARQVNQGFNLGPSTLPLVEEICHKVEGHPLSIELIASATATLSLPELIEDLDDSQAAFDPEQLALPSEGRSLLIVLERAWQLLSEEQRQILCRMVCFKGGFDQAAAQHIAQAPVDSLSSLVDKSFLTQAGQNRFMLHEIIHDFVMQKAIHRGLLIPTKAVHAEYFLNRLDALAEGNRFIVQVETLDQVEVDLENILSAWNFFIDRKDIARLQTCIDILYQFFHIRSLFEEGVQLFEGAIQSAGYMSPFDPLVGMLANRLGSLAQRLRQNETALQMFTRALAIFENQPASTELGLAYTGLGNYHMRIKDFEQALTMSQRALDCFQALDDRFHESSALYLLAMIYQRAADYPTAKGILTQSLQISREICDRRGMISRLNQLAGHDCNEGNFDSAEERYLESLAISRDFKDRYQQAIILNNLASVYHPRKEYQKEQAVLEESLGICREIGDLDGEAIALNNLGELAIVLGEHNRALDYCRSALDIALRLGEDWTIIAVYDILGCAYLGLGEYETASQCLGQAIQTAFQVQSWDLLTRSLVNSAEVHLAQEQTDAARSLLKAALAHPSILYEYRLKAIDLLEDIGGSPPEEKDEGLLIGVLESHFDLR